MSSITDVGVAIADGFTRKLQVSNITVFLAGGRTVHTNTIRPLLRKELGGRPYVRGFDVLYPEELFQELLSRKPRQDLLTLETLLATSANAVIIIVESPGSIAELGAFVNSNELRPKLVAVVNKKHRNEKSFIMLGPVAQLRNERREAVIMHDFGQPDIPKLADEVRRVVRQIAKEKPVDESLKNPIRAQYFILASIFVAEPVELVTLINLLVATNECDTTEAPIVATTALNILMRQKEITMKMNYYLTMSKGSQRLKSIIQDSKEGQQFVKLFDKCRVDMLNFTLRKSSRRYLPVIT